MANLADLMISIGTDTTDLTDGFDKVPDAADDAVDQTEGIFEGMSGKLAMAAGAAGVAAGAALVAGIVGAINIDAANDKLSAQLNLSAAESEQAGGIAGSLYAGAYGESIEDVNEAVGAVASSLADLGSGDVEQLSAKALDLAAAFDLDVNQAVTTAGQMMRNGLVSDADEAMDLITAGLQSVPAAMRDEVFPVMDEYGVNFAALGLDGDEAISMIVAASDNGVIAMDKMGDALKELTIRGTDMSDTSVEAYEAAGLSAEEMSADLLAGGDTAQDAFTKIVEGLQGIEDPTDQAAAAIGLFGTPLEDLGTSEIPAFLDSLTGMEGGLGDVAGRAAEMGDTLNQGPGVALETLKRSFFQVATDVGSIFLPALAEGATALTERIGPAVATVSAFLTDTLIPGLQAAAGWVERWQIPITVVAGLLVASYIPAIVASGVASTVSAAKQVAAWTVTRAAAIQSVALAAVHAASVVAGWVMMGVQSMLQAARMAAAWLIAMGPVGWVIAAVVALVAVIVANWDTVVEWTKKAWTWVTDKIGDAWNWITDTTNAAVSAVVGFFADLKDRAVSTVSNLRDRVVGFFTSLKDRAVEIIVGMVTAHIQFITNLRDTVVDMVSGLRDRVVEFFGGLKDGAVDKVEELVDKVLGIKDTVLDFFRNAGTWLLDAGRNIIQGLIDGIGDMIGGIGDAIGNVTSRVTDYLPWSPAKRGPLKSHPPELAGRNIVSLMADGMGANVGLLAAQADAAARAAMPNVGTFRMPGVSSASVSTGGGATSPDRFVLVLEDGTELGGYVRRESSKTLGPLRQMARSS